MSDPLSPKVVRLELRAALSDGHTLVVTMGQRHDLQLAPRTWFERFGKPAFLAIRQKLHQIDAL
jgi:hypothetical protein